MSSRAIEKTVFVDAPADVVWRAITEAEQLAQWFPVEARVQPGVGGSIWLSWGGGTEGTAPIAHWEPLRRLGWTEARGEVTLAVDFYLEPRGSGTLVRLVQSGFGAGTEWDDEFHMTAGGWSYFVGHLKWWLERHRGLARQVFVIREPVPFSRPDALARLIGPDGLCTNAALDAVNEGERYATRTSGGDELSGTVIAVSRATGQLGLTLDQLGGSILFLEMEPHPRGARAGFWLSTYGVDSTSAAEAGRRFRALYDKAFGL